MNQWMYMALITGMVASAPQAFSLDTAYARGDSCLNIVWVPDSVNTRPQWYANNGGLCTGEDSIYRHCDFLPGVTYRSIAYSYGGEDPHDLFREKLADGFLAGSHLCHYRVIGDPSPFVAGTDCSGFACHLWNVPRVSTVGLVNDPRYETIARSQLQAGDLLVRAGSHAVFVVEQDEGTRYLIWESTSAVNGCRERIVDVADAYWDPYVALRNPQLVSSVQPHRGAAGRLVPVVDRVRFDPASGHLYLRCIRPFSGNVTVCDMNGQVVYTVRVDCDRGEHRTAPVVRLARGVYAVSVENKAGCSAFAIIH